MPRKRISKPPVETKATPVANDDPVHLEARYRHHIAKAQSDGALEDVVDSIDRAVTAGALDEAAVSRLCVELARRHDQLHPRFAAGQLSREEAVEVLYPADPT